MKSFVFANIPELYNPLNLFLLDFVFLEVNRSLLLQHGHRWTLYKFTSTNIPHIEHGLWPTAKR